MSKVDDGGPAFPVGLGTQHEQHFCHPGMSLRDYFAAAALNGLLSSGAFDHGEQREVYAAHSAYCIADAMLAARKREG